MKMPIDKEWFEKRPAAEGDPEIGAGGNRKTMTINLTDEEIAQLERLINPDRITLRQDEVKALLYGAPKHDFTAAMTRLAAWLAECGDAHSATPSPSPNAEGDRGPLFWVRLGARAFRASARATCGSIWESNMEDAMTSAGLSKLDKERLAAASEQCEEISKSLAGKCEDAALGYASYMGSEEDRALLAEIGVTSDWHYRVHTGELSRKEIFERDRLDTTEGSAE